VQINSIGAPRRSAETSSWAAAFLLMTVLLGLRLNVCGHPWPVHPDEREFVAAIGFPRPYPVHPPGYPLWVALGTALSWAGLSPYVAYQLMSVAASCIGPAVLFFWLRGIVGSAIAWWAGFALGVNPIWWFEGVTSLNYSVGNCAALGVVALCWNARSARSRQSAVWAAVLLAVLGLLRPDTMIWLGPLMVFSAGWSAGVLAFSIAIVFGFGRWFYHDAPTPSVRHTLEVVWSTSVFSRGIVDGVLRNAVKLGVYLGWGLGMGGLILVWELVRRTVARGLHDRPSPFQGNGKRVGWFLLLWLGPVLCFQLLVHVTEVGHSLWYLPAIYFVMAAGLALLRSRRLASGILVLISITSIAQFYLYPWRSDVSGWRRVLNAKVAFASAQGLARIDQRDLIHRPNDFWTVPGRDEPR